jgi:hypothetical protein
MLVLSLFVVCFDAAAVLGISPDELALDPLMFRDILRATVVAAIWIPYMRVSKRVKATFVL